MFVLFYCLLGGTYKQIILQILQVWPDMFFFFIHCSFNIEKVSSELVTVLFYQYRFKKKQLKNSQIKTTLPAAGLCKAEEETAES